uniref:Uncharacterized protein n=3 Tax=Candidatus Kentrum sp. FM TaxID=2126340 RepID=A0A450TVX0_9GAMM|nr:MAG: hypothetical protein BECKFM1743C_GA0114222_107052 [Candidatus Kentron sp. FM]
MDKKSPFLAQFLARMSAFERENSTFLLVFHPVSADVIFWECTLGFYCHILGMHPGFLLSFFGNAPINIVPDRKVIFLFRNIALHSFFEMKILRFGEYGPAFGALLSIMARKMPDL